MPSIRCQLLPALSLSGLLPPYSIDDLNWKSASQQHQHYTQLQALPAHQQHRRLLSPFHLAKQSSAVQSNTTSNICNQGSNRPAQVDPRVFWYAGNMVSYRVFGTMSAGTNRDATNHQMSLSTATSSAAVLLTQDHKTHNSTDASLMAVAAATLTT